MPARATEVLAVAALAAMLTLVIAAPVLRSPSQRVFGVETVGRHHDPFTMMRQFERPIGIGVYSQPVTDVSGALLARLSGGVAAYNWLVLLSFPLAAAAAYLLARHLALSAAGATVAALAYAFSPFHLAQAAYHPHVAQTQWLPLYLLALWRCLDAATPAAVGFLGAAAIVVTLSNFYGGLIAAVITPIAVVAYWLVTRREGLRPARRLAVTVGTLALLAGAGLAYVARFGHAVLLDRAAFAFPRADLFLYGAKWWGYLVPPVAHPLLGATARRIWDSAGVRESLLEQQVSLGWGLVALGLVAVSGWLVRERQPTSLARVPVLVVVAAAALLCSLSPERKIWGLTFVRPSALLYALVPMFRAYARFGVIVQLMAALLAGIGVDRLLRSGVRSARLVCLALVVLVAGEYAVSPTAQWREVLPTTAHRWIARQPVGMRVLDCTLLGPASASADEWLTGGRVSTPGGPLADCAEPGLAAKIAALGYTHLLVRRGGWESRWFGQHRPGGLVLQAHFEDADLLAVTATPPAVYTAEMTAFFPVERRDGLTWRWLGQDAAWKVVNRSGRPIVAALDIETWALGGIRRLEVLLDRREVSILVVGQQRGPHRIGPLALAPGGHELLFRALEPPTVADDLLHNGDRRPLSFAFGAWRWTVPGERS